MARKFPEAAKLHSRSPLRRSKEKDIDYESQIPLLIAHKSPKEMKVDVVEVANELVKCLQENMPEALERVSVGHGHNLNFRVRLIFVRAGFLPVSDKYLFSKATDRDFLTTAKTDEKIFGKVLIDYASPNMAKGRADQFLANLTELHVGHLRSTMIGACLNSVFTYKGSLVTGYSHVGDFGSPLGSVIAEVQEGAKRFPFLDYIKQGKEGEYIL